MGNANKTHRGFDVYGEFKDKQNQTIRVVESSEVGRPCCHVFVERDNYNRELLSSMLSIVDAGEAQCILKRSSAYLSVDDAKQLIKRLEHFIEQAESDDNWRNDPKYVKDFG